MKSTSFLYPISSRNLIRSLLKSPSKMMCDLGFSLCNLIMTFRRSLSAIAKLADGLVYTLAMFDILLGRKRWRTLSASSSIFSLRG